MLEAWLDPENVRLIFAQVIIFATSNASNGPSFILFLLLLLTGHIIFSGH